MEIQDPESTLLVLKKARAKIEEGWCQGMASMGRHTQHPQYCVIGALLYSVDGQSSQADRRTTQEFMEAGKVLKDNLPSEWRKSYGRDLVTFNDYTNRTQEEVVNLFDRSIVNFMKGQ